MWRMVIVLVIVGLCVHTAVALPGSGTQQDPWRIQSLADFDEFAANANYWSGFTRLETDVNLAGRTYSTAVIAPDTSSSGGFQGTSFTGVFDGNDHKIICLTINDGGAGNDFLGLFGFIGGYGEVKNLGLEAGSVSGRFSVGGLVGMNGGDISNCYSTGDVSGDYPVGGLVGANYYGDITNCYSTGSVRGTGWYVGGLVGDNYYGDISDCYSTGDVSGDEDVGGLVGYNYYWWYGTITNCYSTGSVSGNYYVGGLVGWNYGSVLNCYFIGDVNGVEVVGGLVGENYFGNVSNCYSTGCVTGSRGVGGLVGWNDVNISNSYSTASVGGTDYVGGLVGGNGSRDTSGSVTGCYSSGMVSGESNVGGLVGYIYEGYIEWSFWDVETSGEPNMCGGQWLPATGCDPNCGKTTAQMQTRSTFTEAGWDFVEIWGIGENQTYPYLRFAPAGDFNYDKKVDLLDLAIFADHWLEGKDN